MKIDTRKWSTQESCSTSVLGHSLALRVLTVRQIAFCHSVKLSLVCRFTTEEEVSSQGRRQQTPQQLPGQPISLSVLPLTTAGQLQETCMSMMAFLCSRHSKENAHSMHCKRLPLCSVHPKLLGYIILEVVLRSLSIADTVGTQLSVLYQEVFPNSEVVLYTALCSWDSKQCPQ